MSMLLTLLISISISAQEPPQQPPQGPKTPLELQAILRQLNTESNVQRRIELSQNGAKIYFSRFLQSKHENAQKAVAEGFAFCTSATDIFNCRKKFISPFEAHADFMTAKILYSRILFFLELGASTELNTLIKKQLFNRKSKLDRQTLVKLGLKYVSELISQMNYVEASAINKFLTKRFSAELKGDKNSKIWQQANSKYIYFAFGNKKEALKLAAKNVPPISSCKAKDFDIRKGSQIYSAALDSLMMGDIRGARPFLESCHVVFAGLLQQKNMTDLSRWVDYNSAIMMILTGKWSGAGKLLQRFEKSLADGDVIKQAWKQIGDVCLHHKSRDKKRAQVELNQLKGKVKSHPGMYGKNLPRFVANIEKALSGKKVNFGKANHLKYCFIKG